MPEEAFRYLFGPVRSRRLGWSLGVDPVPAKTCCYDCAFCQVGLTPQPTLERRAYTPVAAILAELDRWIARGGKADCVTLSGAGEPTLHLGLGELLAGIRDRISLRRVLLSNGALFWLPDVRRAAMLADVVKVSLSAWDDASFHLVNRPAPELRFENVLAGLRQFRREWRGAGEFWIEVFLMDGINAADEQVRRIAELARECEPDHIHLNTVSRPPADGSAKPVPIERLQRLATLFHPVGEVIAESRSGPLTPVAGTDAADDAILNLVRRHPSRAEDVAPLSG